MRRSLEQVQKRENYLVEEIDESKDSLQKRMEDLLPKAETDYQEYLQEGKKPLWRKRRSDVVDYVAEARKLLDEHGSKEAIQELLELDRLEIENVDDARLLAFCYLIEKNKRQ